ncbi:hypothetical protein ZYGR_0I03190 [Zygosaccharomyces rouxii]|uniref:ZYRO0C07634p n=2 Tax=Zygosaccharomyces rouxii TaxID=4956 RepID=C5DTD5_ZYGRC|nr:uncharacterized protein ZYRO0C07634g [Zygosaccharomyces rouxii]KAH9201773.1 cyclin-domain-containing protein [Zygosaccharomyces rouxii]GAV48022.1 hypothetical protein ZYGR_0I03190 [Zygosaccharomyces rouxii]CAR27046.1 ZYRO0C07634p [Zygosaccharomyces rouxii]
MYDNDRVAPSVFTAPNAVVNVGNNNVQGPPTTGIRIDNVNDVPTVILPKRFSECSRTDLVILISRMLTFLIQMNDSSSTSALDSVTNLTKFHSKVPPGISVYNYLMRLTKYSSLDHCVLMAAVYYIDLVSSVYPTFTLNSLTVHRFLLTATTVASKGLCDSFCTNTHYAKVGGVHCSELNVLECELLRRINYRIIPRDDNIAWCNLESQHRHFVLDTQDGDDWTPILSNLSGNRNNSGYNVLDTYYNKIVQLVGSLKSTQDKSKLVNYTFANTLKPTNIHNNEGLNLNPSPSGNNDKMTTTCNNGIDNDNNDGSNSNSNSQIGLEQGTSSRKRNLDTDVYESGNESYGKDITGCENTLRNGDRGTSGNLNKRHFNRQKKDSD